MFVTLLVLLFLQLQVTVILEVMMRKCGSASVKSLVPAKYLDFVKDVFEVYVFMDFSYASLITQTDNN